jgi:hypothetical protein
MLSTLADEARNPRRDPDRWPLRAQFRRCLQRIVDLDVPCGHEGVQVGVH